MFEVLLVAGVGQRQRLGVDLSLRGWAEAARRPRSGHSALAGDIVEQAVGADDPALRLESVNIGRSLVAAQEPVALEPFVMHLVR